MNVEMMCASEMWCSSIIDIHRMCLPSTQKGSRVYRKKEE